MSHQERSDHPDDQSTGGLSTPVGSRRTFFHWVTVAAAGCHRIHGEGGAVAPDLSTIGETRPDRAWHIKHFHDPQSLSPGSCMPKFPLTDQQLNDLTTYMLSLKRTT